MWLFVAIKDLTKVVLDGLNNCKYPELLWSPLLGSVCSPKWIIPVACSISSLALYVRVLSPVSSLWYAWKKVVVAVTPYPEPPLIDPWKENLLSADGWILLKVNKYSL